MVTVVKAMLSGDWQPGSKPNSVEISRMTLSKLRNLSMPKILGLKMKPAVAPYSCEYQMR